MTFRSILSAICLAPLLLTASPEVAVPAKDTAHAEIRSATVSPPVHHYTVTHISRLDGTVPPKGFRMDDYIRITIGDGANPHAVDGLLQACPSKNLVIWLNGIAFPCLPISNVNPQSNTIIFKLACDTVKTSTWKVFYDYSTRHFMKETLPLNVQLGNALTPLTEITPGSTMLLKPRELWMKIGGYVFLALLLIVFIYLVRYHGILRDYMMFDESVHITNKLTPGSDNEVLLKNIPFSLARTQLAFWTLLVVFSVVYVWVTVDELITFNDSIVILLGISGGTSIIARLIDKSHNQDALCLKAVDFTDSMKSKGFLSDLLSDEKGISIHRFQLVVFTLIFGIYFYWHVIYSLEMPVFSFTILLLMGVSNTTYAGVKLSEK